MPIHLKRLVIALLIIVGIGAIVLFDFLRKQGKTEDILTLQGVEVCRTNRDSTTGGKSCPKSEHFITACGEATTAIQVLGGIKLLPSSTTGQPDCELRTVNEAKNLYAVVVLAYYPSNNSTTKTQAISSLYSTYTNFYQPYLLLDISTPPLLQSVGQSESLQAFSPAFLIKGEPGFRMFISLEDENGTTQPGDEVQIRVFCGIAEDIMTAEPSGTSWFSFAGFEKLKCGALPLKAEVIVRKEQNGEWIKNTPTYSYAFTPDTPPTLQIQNHPQPSEAIFVGKWQGISVKVQVNSRDLYNQISSTPLAEAVVSFFCEQNGVIFPTIPLKRSTNKLGRVVISLADAKKELNHCPSDNYLARLTYYDSQAKIPANNDSTYDFYFENPGPIPAGRVSGLLINDGVILGQELAVGGFVGLDSVGGIQGGLLTNGSQICLFYPAEAAQTIKGCPLTRSSTSLSVQADQKGQYLFGGEAGRRLSYGDYLKSGAGKVEIRILNYKNEAYPAGVVNENGTVLNPKVLAIRNIHLPTSESELKNHVCQAVIKIWNDEKECAPLFNIIFRESRWNVSATNGSSGACGLFQSNPCSKYQATSLPGEEYKAIGNQIRWGIKYIQARYGSPSKAWVFWQGHNNY